MKHKSYQGRGLSSLSYKLTVFLACLFALGCTSENEALTTTDGTDGGEIQLGASVNLETRATGLGFELNDRIGLYLAKWVDAATPGVLADSGNYADNALFELNTLPDSWTTTPKRYYPADGGALDFYAYYPYRDSAFVTGTTLNLTVASDQSAYADYTRSDFMVAKTDGVKRSTSKVHLDFYHRLSQMVFVLKPGVGFTVSDLLGAKVKVVNAVVDGTFDLSQGASGRPTEGSTRQDVTPYGTWTVGDSSLTGMMAIVMPQYIDARTYVEVMVGSRKFAFKPTTPIEMRPGCSKEFTITVSNTGIDIETQIHPWNNCGAESGEAKEEDAIVRATVAKQSVQFRIYSNDERYFRVDWGDGTQETVNVLFGSSGHNYTDGKVEHEITIYGSQQSIQTFVCVKNEMKTLDVSRNLKLQSLTCGSNQLKTLDVSKNSALTGLQCGGNQLKALDVSQNLVLGSLQCGDNQLDQLDVSKNVALKTLDCENNLLTTLDISQNPTLRSLNCSGNSLEKLDVSQKLSLSDLACENNLLTDLVVSNNSKLKYLYASHNRLSALNVDQNVLLIELECSHNPIETLNLSQNPNLTLVACDSCGLDSLAVSTLGMLSELSLADNHLTGLDIRNNVELSQLKCNGNRIDFLDVSNNTMLTRIRCDGNPFFDDGVRAEAFANTLLDLTGKSAGQIVAFIEEVKTAISSVCSAKNWTIVEELQ